MLVAATDKGICRLTFDEDEAALRAPLPQRRRSLHGGAGDGRPGRRHGGGGRTRRRSRTICRSTSPAPPSRKRCGASCAGSRPARPAATPQIAAAVGQPGGGARGRHRQWRQPCRGADPLPPRDPHRRHARRLCLRPRAQGASCSPGSGGASESSVAAGRRLRRPACRRPAPPAAPASRARFRDAVRPAWRSRSSRASRRRRSPADSLSRDGSR